MSHNNIDDRCGPYEYGGSEGDGPRSVTAEPAPTFNPAVSRFDQSTFSGRLQQIIAQLDPMKLFVSHAEIDAAVALVNAFKEGSHDPSITDAELWAAKELIECRIHPDTGELTPALFCFAAYTPMQPPIIVGLLTASSPAAIVFWQWFNQSYNAAVFYANKSVSAPMSNSEIFAAYCAAVTAALSVGMGTRALGTRRSCLWSCRLLLVGRVVPGYRAKPTAKDLHRSILFPFARFVAGLLSKHRALPVEQQGDEWEAAPSVVP